MIERRQHLGFTLKARESLRIVRKEIRQDLDGHVTSQPGVARAIHLSHPALSEQRRDFIGSYRLTNLK
jgi:hypothetical protein